MCMQNLNKIVHQVREQEPSANGLTEGRTLGGENLIPHHYHVLGYKNQCYLL